MGVCTGGEVNAEDPQVWSRQRKLKQADFIYHFYIIFFWGPELTIMITPRQHENVLARVAALRENISFYVRDNR